MQTLPTLRPSRVATTPVPTASTVAAGKVTHSTLPTSRIAPKLKPTVRQRPSKPLAPERAGSIEPHVASAATPQPPARMNSQPSTKSTRDSAPSSSPTASAAAGATETVTSPPRTLSETTDASLAQLTILCQRLLGTLSPATECALCLRDPLTALMDDMNAVRRANESGRAAPAAPAPRLVVAGSSPSDREAILAFLWGGSGDATEVDREVLSDASLSSATPGSQAPLRARRTRQSSMRSTHTAAASPQRLSPGLFPFPPSSASHRSASPSTPSPAAYTNLAYDERLLYTPTDTISMAAFPSSCESSQMYPFTAVGDRDGSAWILASPHMEIVQLMSPSTPSCSPMSSSLQLPAAPLNPHVRTPNQRQASGRKDDPLTKASPAALSHASVSVPAALEVPGGGGSGGVGVSSLVQRFTAGINQFTHHRRISSSGTDTSGLGSPSMGPQATPGLASDRPPGIAADSPRATPVATNNLGAAWEGLLAPPRSRAETLPSDPVGLPHRKRAPCTAQIALSPHDDPTTDGDGDRATRRSSNSTATESGSVRRASALRGRHGHRVINVQSGAFDLTALDLAASELDSVEAMTAHDTPPPTSSTTPCRGEKVVAESASPPSRTAEESSPSRRTSSESPSIRRSQRPSSVLLTTPANRPHPTAWVLTEQAQAVVFPEVSVSITTPPAPTDLHDTHAVETHPPPPPSTATIFTGDAYLCCVPSSHIGRPALSVSLACLFGPLLPGTAADVHTNSSPLSSPTDAISVSHVVHPTAPHPRPLPPPQSAAVAQGDASLPTSAAAGPKPAGAFPRRVVPVTTARPHPTAAAPPPPPTPPTVDAEQSWLRASRQLVASQTFFVLTRAEAALRDTPSPLSVPSPSADEGSGEPSTMSTAGSPERDVTLSCPSPLPLASSRDDLVNLFCAQVRGLYGVVVAPWQVIPFSAQSSIAARDFLLAYHRHRHPGTRRFSTRQGTPPPPSAKGSAAVTHTRPSSSVVSTPRSAGGGTAVRHGQASSPPRRRTADLTSNGESPSDVQPQGTTPLGASPSPPLMATSILKKPGQPGGEGTSPLPSSAGQRVTSFRGSGFADDDTDDELTFDREDVEGFNDVASLSSASGFALSGMGNSTPVRNASALQRSAAGRTTPPFSLSPTTVFDPNDAAAPSHLSAPLPPWRLTALPLAVATSRLCDAAHDPVWVSQATTAATAAEPSSEALAVAVYQHVSSDLWRRCGAAALSARVKHFERVSTAYRLSRVAVSLQSWSGHLLASLADAGRHAEAYKAKLQRRLVLHEESCRVLNETIARQEGDLCPSTVVPGMHPVLETAFRDMCRAFARDVRVMLLLQEPPRELGETSSPAVSSALARLREQVALFHAFYYGGRWEQTRASVLAKMEAARRRRSSHEAAPHAPAGEATTGAATSAGVRSRSPSTSATCAEELAELDRQLVTRLSQLNTEIINLFLQCCARHISVVRDAVREEVHRVHDAYESLLTQLAALRGAERRVPLSSTRRSLRSWRQQLALVTTPSRAHWEPLVTALRAALCEDQIRALARVYKASTRSHGASVAPTPKPPPRGASQPSTSPAAPPRKLSAPSARRAAVPPAPPAGSGLSMATCLGNAAGELGGVGKRARRLLAKPRYAQPTHRRPGADDEMYDEDGHTPAMEFSLWGAASLRRGPFCYAASNARGLNASPHMRPHRRGSSSTVSALPLTFLAKVSPEVSLAQSPPPSALNASLSETQAALQSAQPVNAVLSPPPCPPAVTPLSGPGTGGAAASSAGDDGAAFAEALGAWRSALPSEVRPPSNFSESPLLYLVAETWDEVLLTTPIHAWLHYHEREYSEAVHSVATDLLAAQKSWLRKIVSTDETIKEHVNRVDVELGQLTNLDARDSVRAVVQRVCIQSEAVGHELAAARQAFWMHVEPDLMI